jgi:hypothetical protein
VSTRLNNSWLSCWRITVSLASVLAVSICSGCHDSDADSDGSGDRSELHGTPGSQREGQLNSDASLIQDTRRETQGSDRSRQELVSQHLQAEQLASEHLRRYIDILYLNQVDSHAGLWTTPQGDTPWYIVRFKIAKDGFKLNSEATLPSPFRSSPDGSGSEPTAAYRVSLVSGITVQSKPWHHSALPRGDVDAGVFPFIYEWSPEFEFDQVFGSIVVRFFESGEHHVASALERVSAIDRADQIRIFNSPQEEILESKHAKAVLSDSRRIVSQSIHSKGDSYFVCSARLNNDVARKFLLTSRTPDNPNDAMDPTLTQTATISITEVVGRFQMWIDELNVSQADRVNGIEARGVLRIRMRGFSRKASVNVYTWTSDRLGFSVVDLDPAARNRVPANLGEYAEEMKPLQAWSNWNAAATHAVDWTYSVSSDGAISWHAPDRLRATVGGLPTEIFSGVPTLSPPSSPNAFMITNENLDFLLEETHYLKPSLPREVLDEHEKNPFDYRRFGLQRSGR